MKDTLEMALETGFFENGGNVYGGHTNLKAFEALVRADEREACAVIAETACDYLQNSTFQGVANAIRARGNT